MLSLGHILILDLVTDLFTCIFTSRYDSTSLGHTLKVFLHKISSLL